jgi:hypothetical protein
MYPTVRAAAAAIFAAAFLAACGTAAARPDPDTPLAAPATASPVPTPTTVAPVEAATTDLTVLRIPGAVPSKGSGTFEYAQGSGPVSGSAGPTRRYRVAVEQGIGEDAADFAAAVEATLSDPRSWTGDGSLRLQRVADDADFTVYLAGRETAGRMCLAGGTNIRVGGVPYTSCRSGGQAIINLDRWRLSANPYVDGNVPIGTYRQYVVNHEVGHELGHRHQDCPRRGEPAPVMVQQTLRLGGCIPYAWPMRDGSPYTGPAR